MSEAQAIAELVKTVKSLEDKIDKLSKNGVGKKAKVKDPNAPKRPMNAYFIFQNEERPKIKAKLQKKLKDGEKVPSEEVSEILKSTWAKIKTDAKYAKRLEKYTSEAAKEKAKYIALKKAYDKKKKEEAANTNVKEDAEDSESEEEVVEKPVKKTKKKTKKAPAPKPKSTKKPKKKKPVKKVVEESSEEDAASDDDSDLSEIASLDTDEFSDEDLLEEI